MTDSHPSGHSRPKSEATLADIPWGAQDGEVKHRIALLVLAMHGCDSREGDEHSSVQNEQIGQSASSSVASISDASACREDASNRGGLDRQDSATSNRYMGRDTGAWVLSGRHGDEEFVYMRDSNPPGPGSLFVVMQIWGGTEAWLSVRAFGSGRRYGAEFKGAEWQAASTGQRAAIVRAALVRSAELAAGHCEGDATTLDEELETFDGAFAVFDQIGR